MLAPGGGECRIGHPFAPLVRKGTRADGGCVQRGLRTGHLLSLGGAAAVLGSLWMPWYAINLQGALNKSLTQSSSRIPPALSEMAKGLVQILPKNIRGTGWQAFAGADVAMAGGAALVVLAMVMAAGAGG